MICSQLHFFVWEKAAAVRSPDLSTLMEDKNLPPVAERGQGRRGFCGDYSLHRELDTKQEVGGVASKIDSTVTT